MSWRQVEVFRMPMRSPGDMSGLQRLIRDRTLDPRHIVAVLGKTEGNGGVNDFTREYASRSFASVLAAHFGCTAEQVEDRVALVMSGGTEGVLSPHASVFVRREVEAKQGQGKRLALGVAHTREFLPEELGRRAQIDATAEAVHRAMRDAQIESVADVHFVQIKCPLLTSERIEAAALRGQATVTDEPYTSMAFSRGASALGVALALGEIAGPVPDAAVLRDWHLHSSVASASAGIELTRSVVVVMGNAEAAAGDGVVAHSVMRDALDLRGVLDAFGQIGVDVRQGVPDDDWHRRIHVFAKAEPSPDGKIRGYRHTMLDDSDINPTRHARAAVGGLIAGVCGTGAVYVSGGAEHQGPAGGGPVAVIAFSPEC
jgi:cyanuric acid amidohydrolase